MAITQLYNRTTLREHPDLSPKDDATFEKGHSFIFPGDELVFCTKLKCPEDIGGSLNGVTMQSVKCSMVAESPDIFTDVFDDIFASTKSFELESFTVQLNNVNCKLIPFAGFGYAYNIDFNTERNFQLADGDFRKKINFFSELVAGSPDYVGWNFWYPVNFREEYWMSLATADNDFYDSSQFQNGQNQKWQKYHIPPTWLIKYKLELNYSTYGVPNVIFSELNLSNEALGINDYNTNTDFTLKSIKTCGVGGTPINTPFAPIFNDKNTSCFAYFTKATAWIPEEEGSLTAIFRIRPEETGDQSAWNRVSSKYKQQSTDVWVYKTQNIITNSGFKIKTNSGLNLVTNQSVGGGCIISLDPLDHKKIQVYAEIDYKKLALKYPGVQKFSLYCRLYNNTTYTT